MYTLVEPDRQETSPIPDTHSFSYNLVPNPRGTARTSFEPGSTARVPQIYVSVECSLKINHYGELRLGRWERGNNIFLTGSIIAETHRSPGFAVQNTI